MRVSPSHSCPMARAFGHLRQLLDLSIDLGGPDPHPTRIQRWRRTRPWITRPPWSVQDAKSPCAHMPGIGRSKRPDSVTHRRHREPQRHRRERRAADQFARTPGRSARTFRLIDHIDIGSQRRTLDLPGIHGAGRVTDDEAATEVGSPLMDARCRSGATSRYTKSNPSADSRDPVDVIVRSADRSWVVPGVTPAFSDGPGTWRSSRTE